MRVSILALTLLAAPLAVHAQAQARPNPSVLLQSALHQETVNGNLDSAITLYRRVAEDRRVERALVARALVGLGRTYELRGQTEAIRAYQRVVTEFGDQSAEAATARQRLAALQTGATQAGNARDDRRLTFSVLYENLPRLRDFDAPHYDYSPNGDQIVIRIPRDTIGPTEGAALVVATSAGVVTRTLVPSRPEVGLSFPRWSPDGKYIVYREGAWLGSDTSWSALRIIPADGGPSRVLTNRTGWSGARGGLFWTPDSKAITIATRAGLVTMDLDGKVLRTVPFEVKHLTQAIGYSPDGRWVTLQRLAAEDQTQMDVYLMPAEGGQQIQVTRVGGWNWWPTWAPDGRSIYFVSTRDGVQNIWNVAMDPRTGAPQGDAVQITSYSDVKIKHPKIVGGKLAFALVRETGSIRVASTAKPEETRVLARGADPIVSPDGRTVYFSSQGVRPGGLFGVSTDGSSAPRRITSVRPDGSALSPDGRTVAFFDLGDGRKTLRTVDVSTGAVRELVTLASKEDLRPAWSPDGARLAYTHETGLFSIAATGGQPTKLAEARDWEGWSVRYSPDGTLISAFAYLTGDSTNAAVVVPVSGGEPRRLTPKEETGYKEILEWHPDGQRLSYMYYGHKDAEDMTRFAYLDGRPTTKILDQPYPIWDYSGAWHPDGRAYYFIGSMNGSWNLYRHELGTGNSSLIWHHGGTFPGASRPAFSRDGSVMAFETATTTRQLWVIDGLKP